MDDAIGKLRKRFEGRADELLIGLFLDRDFKVHGDFAVQGARDIVSMPLAEFAAKAAGSGAVYLVLAHNHPSGDPTPSQGDREATAATVRACETLGIRMLDHLIFATGGVTSMRALGII
ncbi:MULTISPECIES: JAB domain-containing protein [unclassified Sphingomonas]|nr:MULTISPECIES: JAB domain-containing protein [unclassified Sphingomonas]